MNSMPPIADLDLRRASLCQLLHWLAGGRVQPQALADAYQTAIERLNPELNAYVDVRYGLLQEQAHMADRRRRDGVIGRLDGIPLALKDNFDMAGWPTRVGLPGREKPVQSDAHVVSRLRASGAVLVGKTNMDEGALGAVTDNPHFGATHNPHRHGYSAGGSSGGAAAAVAAGLAVAAIGSDSLGSIRIPASYCGVYALKPTHGEISARGLVPAARRLDAVGLLARSADDLTVLLQVLAGYDADDARSRRRRVAFALPDWEPGNLRAGLLPDLAAVGVQAEVIEVFEAALAKLPHALGDRRTVDFADWDFSRTRRAGLMLMEAEMLGTFAADLANAEHPVSARFRNMLGFAAGKSAADYAVADRVLDAATLKMRRLFAQVDVLVLPTTPQGAFPLDGPAPDSQADLTSFASLAGCPAVSLPMGTLSNGLPIGLQLVGARGSDLRLLELAAVCAATLDVEPTYPVLA
ncbi:amidase [Rhodanobacter sp. T12-5]|uniref:amidase n=1 Tax=Rhodanobacter sp. T12-5 TaxID=2024611 RepID=UPI0011EFDCB9|nr:amidase [Rhodanobacter sp. T12-5]KAA0072406.1 amidase [Rhodanobacter sp. T12-5]